MQETVSGYIDHIIYRNEDNSYTVLVLVVKGEELTCVGFFQSISEGENIEAKGHYTEHAAYGQQFKVDSFTIQAPKDAEAMERYLGSGAITGIGQKLAARIVARFGDDTIRIIEQEPERLAEVSGISIKKAQGIAIQLEEKADMRKAMMFLQQYGISNALSVKIYQQYGEKLYDILQDNPYKMAEDIQGVGFKIADEIAAKVGILSNSEFRIRSGLLYVLAQASYEGHTYLPQHILLQRTAGLLEIEPDYMEKYLMDLVIDRKVTIREMEGADGPYPVVYSGQYYYLELNTAQMLQDLNIVCEKNKERVADKLEMIERQIDIDLEEAQKEAVLEAVCNGVTVITGGPGTGKTTTINTMIKYFAGEGMDVLLAAPTGRAAKRMTETTGYEASTIHRLLELTGLAEDDSMQIRFERNEQNPLEADVIIIDEMSMVDISLMHALLSAVITGTRLILVGDVNQLPSVGAGSVLWDIIRSESFPVVVLDKIFRQAGESDIVVNAHKINRGEPVVVDNKSKDFFFLRRNDANQIISVVIQLVQEKMPKYVNAKPFDVQVLTPMRKGLLGAVRLNEILQEYLNPPDSAKKEREFGQGRFREHDKVMQIKNNYQLEWEIRGRNQLRVDRGVGVFNGDMGIIEEINEYAQIVTVCFDEIKYVDYTFKQLDELELAYAITIHKSQGSEYPAVVLPLFEVPLPLKTRNLLYTAITRAKSCVTLVGSYDTFETMISNKTEHTRYTSLDQRIREIEGR